uniref:NR LBD domain-containing protein n=1 Tax=Caenorhabditis tropicalis TaxID=1561998 RepID=A0A1I7T6M7_9PELO
MGLRKVQDESLLPDHSKIKRYGKEETLAQWEYDILKLTKWLTYFDDFQKLPRSLQIKMIQGVWNIWKRLERLASIVLCVRRKMNEETIRKMKNDTLLCNWNQMSIDMKWCSKYTVEQLKFFLEFNTEIRLDELTRLLLDLDPSDVELSFMLGQLCFHYVGKRFQGEILQVADKFQEILADDLHDYYINQMRQPYYMKRLASMMKINNQIQKEVYKNREKMELAVLFDVFHLEFSHPEMFMDI